MYITQEELSGFDTYKLVPRWVAPNLLTFSGFMLLVLQTLILIFFDPHWLASAVEHPEYPTIPSWVWWLCFCTQFFSHTLDGIDGKQARRTGSSSPMGELFDHGIDSWCVSMFAFGVYSLFGRGELGTTVWHFYFILWMLMTCFLLSHWEKYNTGVLYLPWSYDFSQVTMALSYLIAAIFGTEIWLRYINGWKCSTFFLIVTYGSGLAYSIPVSFYNVYKSYATKTGKQRSAYEAIAPLLSAVVLFFITTTWAVWSPGNILSQYPRWFLTAVGTVLSNIVCRLIVSQMSSCRCQTFNFFLIPIFAVAVVSLLLQDAVVEAWCLKILTTALVFLHIHYGCLVVDQLADHLGIKVFTITKTPKQHGD